MVGHPRPREPCAWYAKGFRYSRDCRSLRSLGFRAPAWLVFPRKRMSDNGNAAGESKGQGCETACNEHGDNRGNGRLRDRGKEHQAKPKDDASKRGRGLAVGEP